MIEVFKTSVQEPGQSQYILGILQDRFPSAEINFDLDDCDNILRIESREIDIQQVKELLHHKGYWCEVLD